jgi:hypothetical protein
MKSKRTKLKLDPSKTAFHAREHNCLRAFHLTAFKIPEMEKEKKRELYSIAINVPKLYGVV